MPLRLVPILTLTIFFVLLLPDVSFAANTTIGNMMCNVSGWMQGSTGRGIATLAMIMLGLLALFNKISWGLAIIHAVGGAIIVGASSIVTVMMNTPGITGCP